MVKKENYYNIIFSIIILISVFGLILFYFIFNKFTQPVYLGPIGPINNFPTIGPTGPTGLSNINVGPIGPTGPTGLISNPTGFNFQNNLKTEKIFLPKISSDAGMKGTPPFSIPIQFNRYYYIMKYSHDDCNDAVMCNNCGVGNKCGPIEDDTTKYYFYLNQYDEPILGDYFVINTIGLKDLKIRITISGDLIPIKTPKNDDKNIVNKYKLFDDNVGDNTWGNELPTLNIDLKPNNIYYFYYIGDTMGTNNSDKSPGPFFVVSVSIFSFD